MKKTPMYQEEERNIFTAIALFFLELVKVLVLAGITIVIVRHFLFKPFYVKGESMSPNYLEKDYLIINQFTYKVLRKEPERGDVVVFQAPIQKKDFYPGTSNVADTDTAYAPYSSKRTRHASRRRAHWRLEEGARG